MHEDRIAVIGLGYVGLPVAVGVARAHGRVVGFDIKHERVDALRRGEDATREFTPEELKDLPLHCTTDPADLAGTSFFIVTVPTPIDGNRQPDLTPLRRACVTVGQSLTPGAVVVFESTVYPGVTEEICGPLLARISGLRQGIDFGLGYSPERINPGDKEHSFTRIKKVVAGDDAETAQAVADLYASVVKAGVYPASSIKVAEAAKVIENTQRDLNIAFVNELSIIFDRLGIDTQEVLNAAGTKWNFLNFRPGLVGGHCIGVDPYYLTHKAELTGYHPEVILAGRRINDGMGPYVARKTVQQIIHQGRNVLGARVNILGLTFKENCKDIRNTKVIDVIRELMEFGVQCFVHDPEADADETMHEYGIKLCSWDQLPAADATIIAVGHKQYAAMSPAQILEKTCKKGCVVMVKPIFDPAAFTREGVRVWRL